MRISETPSGRAVERCMKQGILPVSVPDRSRDPHDGGTLDRAGHRCGRSKRDGLRKADRIRCPPRSGLVGAYRRKDPYGLERLSLILLPTYPSSGSKYGLGAVAVDPQSGVFGTAFGIAADHAILVPGYSLSLGKELTASMLKDQNPISYDAGISVIRNVQKVARRLMESG